MKKNVLLFSHQMKVGGAPTVLCEMGKILSKKYNVVVLSPSDGAMRTQFEKAGISVLISGEITDALRDMIVQEFDFAVANTTLALPFVVKLAGRMPVYWWIHENTLAYEGRQEMKEYYQFAAKYARIFSAGHVAAENFYHFYRIKTEILEFGLSDCYVSAGDNWKRDHINVICPSTVCEMKGQDILVQAIKSMDAGLREKCKFVFLGELRNDNAKEYQYLEVTVTEDKKSIRSELRQSDPTKGAGLADKYRSTENSVQAWLNQPIGHLSRAIMPEEKAKMALYGSPIADFLNRIQLHFSGAMLSSVGLANEIAGFRSEVSTRDIIATYPYPNTLVVCEITGAQLKTVMERSAEYFAYDNEGNVCVSDSFLVPKVEHYNYDYYMGVDFEINPKNPVGSRIVGLSRDGKPVLDEDKFTLCLNNYRYSGAGGYDVYTECPLVKEINVEMVELIMDYFHEYPYIEV